MKRIISTLTALILTCTIFSGALPISAEETNLANQPQIENDIVVKGTNSFGNLLSNEFTAKMDEQQANNGCNVFSAEVIGKEVSIEFETTENCTLVAAVYDEAGVQMLASGNTEVTKGETEKTVTIETDSMPKYFYLKVYLVDTYTLRPVCTVYECPNYTQEMQEFFAKTVDDFDSKRVLNLDENKANNFAVFSNETKIIEPSGNSNKVTKADDASNQYVIENADSSVTSLTSGDTFAYEYDNGEVLIVKVADIKINGTTATITGQDTSMEDVFEYVKIDASQDISKAVVDASDLEEGVTYKGMIEEVDNPKAALSEKAQPYAVDVTGSKSASLSFEIFEAKKGNDDNNVTVSGNINLKIESEIKVYISLSRQYLEFKLSPSAEISVSISGTLSQKFGLAFIGLSPVAGVYIELTPSFIVEANAKIELNGKLSATIGFRVENGKGYKSLNSTPKFEAEVNVEGTFFVGLSLEPKIKVISDDVAEVELEAKVGTEIKSTLTGGENTDSEKHTCKKCIDGNISGKMSSTVKVKLANKKKLTWEFEILNNTIKTCDFYYSFDNKKFDWRTCPNWTYLVELTVEDNNGNPVSEAVITYDDKLKIKTDENGKAEFFLNSGKHSISASKDNIIGKKTIEVKEDAVEAVIKMNEKIGIGKVKEVSLGGYHSAAITENGSLYLWGRNEFGQLGNGVSGRYENNIVRKSYTPIKIMDNVKCVSLGKGNSAAITEDGSLYMWGDNSHGQVGNGEAGYDENGDSICSSTPIKIMDNVKTVSLGGGHSAAITEDGSLYMWGFNYDGQLGNGHSGGEVNQYDEDIDSSTPIKIMDNVKAVRLGWNHSAAITENGSLYMWGFNYYGQLGNGESGKNVLSTTPIKIMDKVKAVSLGGNYSAAITEDGSLYMWGQNIYGQLGNRTTELSSTPIKIMDNVKAVSLGAYHSGAITEDESLYMWGENNWGALGIEITSAVNATPIKIMDNVKEVSLGFEHSGAITKDRSLYMWGENWNGQLGCGSGTGIGTESSTPIKINNIGSVPSASTFSLNSEEQISEISILNQGISILANEETAEKTSEFTGLNPNTIYNFYSVKAKEFEGEEAKILDSNNLLYIGQYTSDENGNLTVTYKPREEYDGSVEFVVEGLTYIGSADIQITNLKYTGEEQTPEITVTLNGTALEKDVDYEAYGDFTAKDLGTYSITFNGIGKYFGSFTAEYTISCEHTYENGVCKICGQKCEHEFADGVCNICEQKCEHKFVDGVCSICEQKCEHEFVDGKCIICGKLIALRGDANLDGKINIVDAAFIAKRVAQRKTDLLPECADYNNDGKLNIVDAAAIAKDVAARII